MPDPSPSVVAAAGSSGSTAARAICDHAVAPVTAAAGREDSSTLALGGGTAAIFPELSAVKLMRVPFFCDALLLFPAPRTEDNQGGLRTRLWLPKLMMNREERKGLRTCSLLTQTHSFPLFSHLRELI